MITVALLGPLEVVRQDGKCLAVPSGKTAELLMRLALGAGTMVRTERLIDELWADDAVRVARNTVQSKVSQLRRALGDACLVIGGTGGYTLALDPLSVDALEVMRLTDETSNFRRVGDPSAALESSAAALAKFRGETMFDGSDAEWLAPHRAVLEGLRLRLIEDHVGSRMDLGAGREVVDELETLVAAHPLREGLSALLMTALYRDGRQVEALAVYTWVRARLGEELGGCGVAAPADAVSVTPLAGRANQTVRGGRRAQRVGSIVGECHGEVGVRVHGRRSLGELQVTLLVSRACMVLSLRVNQAADGLLTVA